MDLRNILIVDLRFKFFKLKFKIMINLKCLTLHSFELLKAADNLIISLLSLDCLIILKSFYKSFLSVEKLINNIRIF